MDSVLELTMICRYLGREKGERRGITVSRLGMFYGEPKRMYRHNFSKTKNGYILTKWLREIRGRQSFWKLPCVLYWVEAKCFVRKKQTDTLKLVSRLAAHRAILYIASGCCNILSQWRIVLRMSIWLIVPRTPRARGLTNATCSRSALSRPRALAASYSCRRREMELNL